jgi:hypothetical protein
MDCQHNDHTTCLTTEGRKEGIKKERFEEMKTGGKAGKNEEAKKTIWNITAFRTVSFSDHTHTITV